jgi:manganese/zinc/iron transport system permease protein
MTVVSVTAVGAFDAVGSVLVVALMIAPPAAAYLLTDHLPRMIFLSVAVGVASALGGYWLSYLGDVSIAGSMATMTGVTFGAAFLFAPERGAVALARRRHRQRWEFAQTMLAIHLLNHEHSAEELTENRESHLHEHLGWRPEFAAGVVRRAEGRGLLARAHGDRLLLTERGRIAARMEMGAG